MQTPLQANFAGGLRLFGYDLSQTTAASDQTADIVFYVAVQDLVTRRYWPAIYLNDAAGLYDPTTGQRLPTTGPDNRAVLQNLTLP